MKLFSKMGAMAVLATVLSSGAALAQDDDITIGFLPGVVDPFYQVMQLGVEGAVADLGLKLVTQIPPT